MPGACRQIRAPCAPGANATPSLREGTRNKMTREKRELSAPPDVEEQGGTEILRLFVTDGALSLSMQRAFEEPGMWGQLLADLAMHAAQIYARETPVDVGQALGEIRLELDAAFDRIQAEHAATLN